MKPQVRIGLLACSAIGAGALAFFLSASPAPTAASSSDPSGEAMPGQIPGWTQTFADDFTSPSTLSNYQVYSSSGPAPDGSGSCVASNHVGVTGGMLVIRGYKDPAGAVSHGCTDDANQWVTGGVKLTANSQTYGKYEVRMRVRQRAGSFLGRPLVAHHRHLAPRDRLHRRQWGVAPHGGHGHRALGHGCQPLSGQRHLAVNLSQWHTVGVEWTPGKIVYTMDGVPWATEANSNVSDVPMQLAVQTQAWQCNSAGTGWETCVDGTTPAEVDMEVDWIAVYAPAPHDVSEDGERLVSTDHQQPSRRAEPLMAPPNVRSVLYWHNQLATLSDLSSPTLAVAPILFSHASLPSRTFLNVHQ